MPAPKGNKNAVKPNKPNRTNQGITLDDSDWKRFDDLAKRLNLSRAKLIKFWLDSAALPLLAQNQQKGKEEKPTIG